MSKLLYLYLSAVCAPRDVAEPPLTDDLQALHVALDDVLHFWLIINTITLARNDAQIQLHLLEATHKYSYTC